MADIYCDCCKTTLGWKYEQAYESSQKYKEGKFIIELAHMIKENGWENESWLWSTTMTTWSRRTLRCPVMSLLLFVKSKRKSTITTKEEWVKKKTRPFVFFTLKKKKIEEQKKIETRKKFLKDWWCRKIPPARFELQFNFRRIFRELNGFSNLEWRHQGNREPFFLSYQCSSSPDKPYF